MEKDNRVQEFIKNPKRALFILAVPAIISASVETAYNLIDMAFVGRLGASAVAALSFAFPLFFILFAIETSVAAGVQSRVARFLGMREKTEAENSAIHGVGLGVLLALMLLPSLFFLRPLFLVLGAQGDVFDLAVSYMQIILPGALLMFPAYIIGDIFIAQGDTKTSMIIDVASLSLNAILAPFFIYYLRLGVPGSALATVCALAFSLVLGIYFLKTRSYLNLRRSSFRFSFRIIKDIFAVGVPAGFMMAMISFYVVFINRFMSHFGTAQVATFGIASKLENVAILPVYGFSSALLTLSGVFYGAGRFDLLKQIAMYGLKVTSAFTIAIGLIFFAVPAWLFRAFTPDKELITLGVKYMRIDVLTFPLMAISMVVSRVLQGMGFGGPGFFVYLIRIFVVAVPLSYVFVYVLNFGFLAIAWAMVLSGLVAAAVGFVWLVLKLKKLNL